jgi:hypothetical protein
VDVDLELDTEPREVAVPPDWPTRWTATWTPGAPSRPLRQRKAAAGAAVEQAKTAETRRWRVVRAVEELRAGRDR